MKQKPTLQYPIVLYRSIDSFIDNIYNYRFKDSKRIGMTLNYVPH